MEAKPAGSCPALDIGVVDISEHFPPSIRHRLVTASRIDPRAFYGCSEERAKALDAELKSVRESYPRLFKREREV